MTLDIVTFPDVEALLVQYLTANIPGTPTGTAVPDPRPSEFFRVMRTGGVRETKVSEAAQITLEAWADSEPRAVALIQQARAYIDALDGQLFGPREIGAPVNLPDALSFQTRYTMTVQIRVRGSVTVV